MVKIGNQNSANMALISDPAVKPLLDQQSMIINRLLKNARIDDIEPLKINDDNAVKEDLYQRLEQYKCPSMSVVTYNEYAQQVSSDIRARFMIKQEHYRRLGQSFTDSTLEDLKSLKNTIVVRDGASYGYNYLENRYFQKPLENSNEIVDLSSYESEIKYYSDTSNLNLAASLKGILKRAEDKGLSVSLLKRLLHKFGSRYVPDLQANLDSRLQEEHCFPIFKCLVEHIDIPRERQLIKMARLKISRKPAEDLQVTIDKLQHVIFQQVALLNPGLEEDKIREATEKLLVNDIKHFVTDAAYKALEERIKTKVALGASPGLKEFVRDLKELESAQPELRPRTVMMAPGADDGTLAIALASESRVNQVSSYGFERRQSRDRGRSPGRFNRSPGRSDRRSPERFDKNKKFDKNRRGNRSQDRFKSFRRDFSRSPSQSKFRNNSPSKFADNRNYQRSSSPFPRMRSQSPFQSPSRRRSTSPYSSYPPRRTPSPSSSPFSHQPRPQNQSGSRDFRRRSFSGDNRSQSRDGRRNSGDYRRKSPASFRQDSTKRDEYKKELYCRGCGSNTHASASCYRYPANNQIQEACSLCLKKFGKKLYHQDSYCRFSPSKYKSPTRFVNKPKN